MRRELLAQVLAPRVTISEMESTIRRALHDDPMNAEKAVGRMYGYVFRKKEARYEAAGGRLHEELP